MQKTTRLLAAFVAAAVTLTPVIARAAGQDKTKDKTTEPSAEKAPARAPAQEVTTQGSVDAEGQHVAYNAVAGTITVGATDTAGCAAGAGRQAGAGPDLAARWRRQRTWPGCPAAGAHFYVAYFKKDAKADERPITFLYNGGPGSSTVWLHMGSLGPKHVVTRDDSTCPRRPTR